MPVYDYKALDSSGSYTQGKVQASSETEARAKIQQDGYTPVWIKNGGRTSLADDENIRFKKAEANKQALAFLTKLHQLLDSGMPIGDAIKTLAQRLKEPRLQYVANTLWKELSEGKTLATAMERFPVLFEKTLLHMIEAGEATGNLEPILAKINSMLKGRIELKKKIQSGLSYPIFMTTIAILVVLFFLFYLVPIVQNIMDSLNSEMTMSAKAIMWIADMSFQFGPFVLIASIVGTISLQQWRKKEEGKYASDGWILKIPILNTIIYNAEQVRMANLCTVLLGSGVNTTETLKLVEKSVVNLAFKERFKEARLKINDGASFSSAFSDYSIFDDMDLDVLSISENTGDIVEGFQKLYEAKYNLIEENMKRLTLVISSVALGFAFSLIILLVFGIATSIMQLSRSIVAH